MSKNNIRLFPTKQIVNAISSSEEQSIYQSLGPSEFFWLRKDADSDNSTNTEINSFNFGCDWFDSIDMTTHYNVEIPSVIITAPNIVNPVAGAYEFTASGINQSNFAFLPFYTDFITNRLELTIGNTTLVEDQADRNPQVLMYKYLAYEKKVLEERGQVSLTDFINRGQYHFTQPGGNITNANNIVLPDFLSPSENYKSIYQKLNDPSRVKNTDFVFTVSALSTQYTVNPPIGTELVGKQDTSGNWYPIVPVNLTYAAGNSYGYAAATVVIDDSPYIGTVSIKFKTALSSPILSKYLTDPYRKDIEPRPYYMTGSKIQIKLQYDPARLNTFISTSFTGGENLKINVIRDEKKKTSFLFKCYNTGSLTSDKNTMINSTSWKYTAWNAPPRNLLTDDNGTSLTISKIYTTTPQYLFVNVDLQLWDSGSAFYGANTYCSPGLINPFVFGDIIDFHMVINQKDMFRRLPVAADKMRLIQEMTSNVFKNVGLNNFTGNELLKSYSEQFYSGTERRKMPIIAIDLGMLDIGDELFYPLTQYNQPLNIEIRVLVNKSNAVADITYPVNSMNYQLNVFDVRPVVIRQDTDAGLITETDVVSKLEEMTLKHAEVSIHDFHSHSLHMYGGGWFDNVKKAYEFITKNAHYVPQAIKTALAATRKFSELNKDNSDVSGIVSKLDILSNAAHTHLGYGNSRMKTKR